MFFKIFIPLTKMEGIYYEKNFISFSNHFAWPWTNIL